MNASKKIYILGILVLLFAAFGYWYFSTREEAVDVGSGTTPDSVYTGAGQEPVTTSADNAQLPNPASVYCIETLRGTLEIVNIEEGQIGVCHLEDGRQCEEWELYRTGTCSLPPGLGSFVPGNKGGSEPL